MLKFVYSFFLGLLLVVFVGMGIASFYPAPKAPEYPTTLNTEPSKTDVEFSAEQKQAQKDYDKSYTVYNKKSQHYSRNVSIIALVAAVILLVVSLAVHAKASILADGLLLGGTFTLLYSIGRSFAGEDPKYSFAVATAGIAITMVVGYLKFIKPGSVSAGKKKK